jgi:arabinose-5-phosphate isomerase
MTVLVEKGFQPDDFAKLHPAGMLAKKVRRVSQLMHRGDQVPIVRPDTGMLDVLYEISSKGLGMTCVVDGDGLLAGIITDGDLRRKTITFPDVLNRTAGEVMTNHPITISPSTLAAEALKILEDHKITALVVVDHNRRVEGVIQIHHLWRTDLV